MVSSPNSAVDAQRVDLMLKVNSFPKLVRLQVKAVNGTKGKSAFGNRPPILKRVWIDSAAALQSKIERIIQERAAEADKNTASVVEQEGMPTFWRLELSHR